MLFLCVVRACFKGHKSYGSFVSLRVALAVSVIVCVCVCVPAFDELEERGTHRALRVIRHTGHS